MSGEGGAGGEMWPTSPLTQLSPTLIIPHHASPSPSASVLSNLAILATLTTLTTQSNLTTRTIRTTLGERGSPSLSAVASTKRCGGSRGCAEQGPSASPPAPPPHPPPPPPLACFEILILGFPAPPLSKDCTNCPSAPC